MSGVDGEDHPRQPREIVAPRSDRRMLELLVCPITRGPLELSPDRSALISRAAERSFPIRDGIPILIEDEATPLSDLDRLKS